MIRFVTRQHKTSLLGLLQRQPAITAQELDIVAKRSDYPINEGTNGIRVPSHGLHVFNEQPFSFLTHPF